MTPKFSVCASIVIFHPDLRHLHDLLTKIIPQVDVVTIFENSPDASIQHWITENFLDAQIRLIRQGDNIGIAAAHNANIHWSKTSGFSHILFLDDDSFADQAMVAKLFNAREELSKRQEKIAAVGPDFASADSLEPYFFIRREGFLFKRIRCGDGSACCPKVDYLISSGSLVDLSVFETVGLFDASLFMDYFDIEWCLRAKHFGYDCFAVCKARLYHRLGEGQVTFMGHTASIHSPQRHYYLFRNMLYLYKNPYVSWKWKIADSYRLLLRVAFYSLAFKPRWQHFRMISLGLWHGTIGRMGKQP